MTTGISGIQAGFCSRRLKTLVVLAAFAFTSLPLFAEDLSGKKALFISSYHPAFAAFETKVKGLREILGAHGVSLDIEFMDSKRIYSPESLNRFEELIKGKIEALGQYDLILLADDNALLFINDCHERLFSGVPVVFFSVNNLQRALDQNSNPLVTGVVESQSIKETVETGLIMRPGTQRVFSITDNSTSGRAHRKEFHDSVKNISGVEFKDLSLENLSFKELYKELNKLTENDLVLFQIGYRDKLEEFKSIDQTLSNIVSNCKAPVFLTQNTGLGYGTVGGKVISHFKQAVTAAEMGIKILSGSGSPSSLKVVTESPNVYKFDNKVLKRFNIDSDLLPEDSILLNKPKSFFTQNKTVSLYLILAFSAMIIFVSGFAFLNYRIRRSQKLKSRALAFINNIVSASPVGLAIFEKSGTCVNANEAFMSLTDISGKNPKELNFRDIRMWQDTGLLEAALEVIESNKSVNREVRSKKYRINAVVNLTPVVTESASHILVVINDITSRLKAEDTLRESETRFRTLFENAPDGVLLHDETGKLVNVNQQACSQLGYKRSELLKKSLKDLDESIFSQFLETKDILENDMAFQGTFTRKDGTEFPVEVRSCKTSSLNKIQYISLARDITDFKEYEGRILAMNEDLENRVNIRTVELQKANDELIIAKTAAESANLAKSRFLANMSHEIRTPMNAIMGFAEILSKKLKDPKLVKHAELIYSSGSSLLNLINDILDLSKVEAGKLSINYTPVSVRQLFDEVSSLFAEKAASKGLDFPVDVDTDVPEYVLLDATRLRQIVINLVSNSCKFTDSGYVRLKCRIIHRDGAEDLEIIVEDSGIGIPKERQKSIFESFVQQPGQKHEKYGGTGLGLAITSNLCSLMNAEINLESQEGEGACFCVTFNDIETVKADIEEKARSAQKKYDLDGVKILIADDIKYNRDVIKSYLEQFDCSFIECENGEEVIAALESETPDVILLDMRMPVKNGVETAEELKAGKKYAEIPIVALSAATVNDLDAKTLKYCDHFISKPVSSSTLLEAISSITAGKEKCRVKISEDEIEAFKQNFNNLIRGRCLEIADSLTINDIQDLCEELESAVRKCPVPDLIAASEKLAQAANDFDMPEVRKSLLSLPDTVNSLK